jgi:hypothetical protein
MADSLSIESQPGRAYSFGELGEMLKEIHELKSYLESELQKVIPTRFERILYAPTKNTCYSRC